MIEDCIQLDDVMSLGSFALREPHLLDSTSAWLSHIPFAFWLVEHHRPETIAELGVLTGTSYCAFCQAVVESGRGAKCYGVDTFEGDAHTGKYDGPAVLDALQAHHDPRYAKFSQLIAASFDEAAGKFSDGSIDLLHIDGCHFYDDVRHDFETWLPKLSRRGIILFHDTAVREGGFGVFKLWAELEGRYPSFEFSHGCGLGVLAVGGDLSPAMAGLFSLTGAQAANVSRFFYLLGSRLQMKIQAEKIPSMEQMIHGLNEEIATKSAQIEDLESGNRRLKAIVDSAEEWQRSWTRRALHRWHKPGSSVKSEGFFLRLANSVRKRCKHPAGNAKP